MAVQESRTFAQTNERLAGHEEGKSSPLVQTLRNLIDDKYNREYKLDKKTRARALEILLLFYAKH